MTLWRYSAVPLGEMRGDVRRGMLVGASASDVRATLRRSGLQPLEIARTREGNALSIARFTFATRWIRGRRTAARAEMIDALSTMLDSGLTFADALGTAAQSARTSRQRSLGAMLTLLRQDVMEGVEIDQALRRHPGWFDEVEIAMVGAGRASGELAAALRSIATRLERRAALSSRLVGIMAYPALVLCVGLGVTGFLGTRTLPQLVGILEESSIEPPTLTVLVMNLGAWLAAWWWTIVLVMPCVAVAGTRVFHADVCRPLRARLRPRVVRALATAAVWRTLADLLAVGVPLAEALRIAAPGRGGSLGASLRAASARIEGGENVSDAFDDESWFDPETRRTLDLAQASGEMSETLSRLAERCERRAKRAIDALAAFLEPALVLTLAFLVGVVVMAAVLPLVRLQEIL